MKPRIALIGARRVRQGLGPFVAHFLQSAGATVCGHLGTTPDSARESSGMLEQLLGSECPGFTQLPELQASTKPDALAILCPPEHHLDYVEAALRLGLHVLCEKPMANPHPANTERIDACVTGFREQGLLLQENCQWPHVLPAFRELTGVPASPFPSSFGMGLSPNRDAGPNSAARMGVDSLSHPLSILQDLIPGPARVTEIQVQDSAAGTCTVRFHFEVGSEQVPCTVKLADSPLRPRPAWLEISGQRADRLIREQDYAIFLAQGERQVAVPDPLQQHLQGFVQTLQAVLQGQAAPDPAPILERALHLQTLLAAFPQTA